MDSPYVMNTASGALLDLADPDPTVICLEDIAAALSKVCRFGAQTIRFYSVAQHAVLVQRLVVGAGRPELALAALHHDSHEAFVGDVTTPLKRMLGPEFVEICRRLDQAIGQALGVDMATPDSHEAAAIKRADDQALAIEGVELLPNWKRDGEPHSALPALDDPLPPEQAELLFLAAHGSPACWL
jgi:hypothetical protein